MLDIERDSMADTIAAVLLEKRVANAQDQRGVRCVCSKGIIMPAR